MTLRSPDSSSRDTRGRLERAVPSYLALWWLAVQVVAALVDAFGQPEWITQVPVYGGAVAVIPMLFLTWKYDLIPDGIRRRLDRTVRKGPSGGVVLASGPAPRRFSPRTRAVSLLVSFVALGAMALWVFSQFPAVHRDAPGAVAPIVAQSDTTQPGATADADETETVSESGVAMVDGPEASGPGTAVDGSGSEGDSESVGAILERLAEMSAVPADFSVRALYPLRTAVHEKGQWFTGRSSEKREVLVILVGPTRAEVSALGEVSGPPWRFPMALDPLAGPARLVGVAAPRLATLTDKLPTSAEVRLNAHTQPLGLGDDLALLLAAIETFLKSEPLAVTASLALE